ncbi:hypothetical protein RUM43_001619 [Polyplax serrata]|uniref:Uncharacterized protein n=1 Tax=Polyplax serrata TaxID=468196 RepID=A0AAN8SE55_POLSC
MSDDKPQLMTDTTNETLEHIALVIDGKVKLKNCPQTSHDPTIRKVCSEKIRTGYVVRMVSFKNNNASLKQNDINASKDSNLRWESYTDPSTIFFRN